MTNAAKGDMSKCNCMMCLAEGDNSPHSRRQSYERLVQAIADLKAAGIAVPMALHLAVHALGVTDDQRR